MEPDRPLTPPRGVTATNDHGRYSVADIEILEGLEPVCRRPHMYLGPLDHDAVYRLLYSVIADGIDRHLAGWLDHLEVTLRADGEVLIRGIARHTTPIGYPAHPLRPVAEYFEILWVGEGAYTRHDGSRAHHTWCDGAAMVSVVNALSSIFIARTREGPNLWRRLEYADGRRMADATVEHDLPSDLHYDVLFRPDPSRFDMAAVKLGRIAVWLGLLCPLVPGLRIDLTDLREGVAERITCHEPHGLVGLVLAQSEGKGGLHTPLSATCTVVLVEPAYWPVEDREVTIEVALRLLEGTDRSSTICVNAHPILVTPGLDALLDTLMATLGRRLHVHNAHGACIAISAWSRASRLAVVHHGDGYALGESLLAHLPAMFADLTTLTE